MTERRVDHARRDQITRLILWARIGVALVLIGFAVGGYSIVQLIERNTKAILVSCTLISNVATEAGAAGGRTGTSKASEKQREITALAFDVIIRDMTADELARFKRLNAELKQLGGFVNLPNCKQVSEHPESVKQLGEQPTQRQRQRTITTPTVTVPSKP